MTEKLKLGGMSCEHCVAKVRSAIEAISGVDRVEVSLENQNATVQVSHPVADGAYAAAVAEAGYEFVGVDNG